MAVQTPDTKDEQDSAYNPDNLHAAEQFGSAHVSAGTDQAEAFANDPANASAGAVKDQEENPTDPNNPWNNKVTGQDSPSSGGMSGILRGAKKKGPLVGLVGLVVGGGSIVSILFTPALLIVQLKETMTGKFNDQLASMDIRSKAILKKKLGGTVTKGMCSPVSLRCKYRTIGNRQIAKLEKAGITVEGGDKKTILGRTKPDSFKFNGQPITAKDMLSEAAKNPDLRSALRHGYNPKFAAFSDAVASKVRSKLGLKKTKNIQPSTSEENMKKQLTENSSGTSIVSQGAPREVKDSNGKVVGWEDASGVPISKDEFNSYKNVINELETRNSLSSSVKKTALKSGLKGVLTSASFGLGGVDTMCTGWTVLRIASFASKVFGARQLIRYAYQFMNTADAIKAGDATPEEVAYLGNILTSQNSEGKSATDSNGYKYALYGDSFNVSNFDSSSTSTNHQLTDTAVNKNEINNETSKYINGQIIPGNLFASFIGFFNGFGQGSTKGAVDSFCKFDKSWTGQGILIGVSILGAVSAFFSGGTTLTAGTVAQVGAMATLSVALGLLTPKLIDLAKGNVITGSENGNEAGNAITSGMGALNAQGSQARGLGVLNKKDALAYQTTSREIAARYNNDEKNQLSPFDTTNNNTFLGSIVSSLLPYSTKFSSVSGGLLATQSLVSSSFKPFLGTNSYAMSAKSSDFNSCSDDEYASKNLAADPFCNLRYGLSPDALAIDPETVLDYMLKGGWITETDSTPLGEYATYVADCIDRSTSIGDISGGTSGDECIQGGANNERNTMFRLFYLDNSINDGMDGEEPATSSNNSTGMPSKDGWVWPAEGTSRTNMGGGTEGWQGNAPGAHKGIDLGLGTQWLGKAVLAAHAGTVSYSQDSGRCGYYVRIKAEGTPYWAAYQHLAPTGSHPAVGSQVTAGQVIGAIGTAGSGPCGTQGFDHLHFSVETKDQTSERSSVGSTIDPLSVLP